MASIVTIFYDYIVNFESGFCQLWKWILLVEIILETTIQNNVSEEISLMEFRYS